MRLSFTKMQGAGNDFIMINAWDKPFHATPALVRALCDRHFGIGGDGIVLICPSAVADAKMRMFNADGSEGKMKSALDKSEPSAKAALCSTTQRINRNIRERIDFRRFMEWPPERTVSWIID